eukprot:363429-Chlamydomonas_euryale.AAC.6
MGHASAHAAMHVHASSSLACSYSCQDLLVMACGHYGLCWSSSARPRWLCGGLGECGGGLYISGSNLLEVGWRSHLQTQQHQHSRRFKAARGCMSHHRPSPHGPCCPRALLGTFPMNTSTQSSTAICWSSSARWMRGVIACLRCACAWTVQHCLLEVRMCAAPRANQGGFKAACAWFPFCRRDSPLIATDHV